MIRRCFAAAIGTTLMVALMGAWAQTSDAAPKATASVHPHLKVSPSKGLTNDETITVSGRGLGVTTNGSIHTWFAAECTTKAKGVRNLAPNFSPHCAPTVVVALHVTPAGTFTATLQVATGKVADSHCGVAHHLTCEIAVGTAAGYHRLVSISFKKPAAPKKHKRASQSSK